MATQGDRSSKKDGITRRQFLDGVAIGGVGMAIAAANPWMTGAQAAAIAAGESSLPAGYYPPTEEGLTGIRDNTLSRILAIDGLPNPEDPHSTVGGPGISLKPTNTRESYDCVIVGAGASGLAAAKYYRDRFGADRKILILDPLADFGGHSHRNEFHVPDAGNGGADVMILRNGGTVNLDSIGTWGTPSGAFLDVPPQSAALDILDFCGVDPDNFPTTSNGSLTAFGNNKLLFPAEDWGGTDYVQRTRFEPNTDAGWTAYLNRLPYSQPARDLIFKIQRNLTTDWIAERHPGETLSAAQRLNLLTSITYKQWLMDYIGGPGLPPEAAQAILEYQRGSHGLLGAGAQATSAADNWLLGRPGFGGPLGLPDSEDVAENGFPGIGRTPQMGNKAVQEPTVAWPDGNASLLRLLVGKLIPATFPGGQPDQDTVVTAPIDYQALDRPGNTVRIRLNCLVYLVKPAEHKNDTAKVEYEVIGGATPGGAFSVNAKHVIMACWNRVTARLVKNLPDQQVRDLCYARKVPLIYGRAALKNWQDWDAADTVNVAPRGNSLFWDSLSLTSGSRFGTTYGPNPHAPNRPASIGFTVVPTGHETPTQLGAYEVGRQRLLDMSFTELEDAVWDVIYRTVNTLGGSFDPAVDVDSIMINRWNYGYAHELTSVFDPSLYGPFADQPMVRGSRPFRNVAIANSDSEGFGYTHAAIQQGYRAVQDLPG
jgi:spermidine dehydrogenase